MSDTPAPDDDALVKCDICMKEVPKSGAKIEETQDYVRHFSGLDCYDKWKHSAEKESSSE